MDRISHSTAVDIGGGRMGFRSKDTVAGIPGTVLPAGWLNPFQEEIMALQEAAGVVADSANWKQVLGAIRSQAFNYRLVGGTANALTFSSVATHKIPAYVAGHPFRFVTGANPNTAACTFKADDLAAVPLVKRGGGALLAGDLPPDTAFHGIYVAGSVRLLDLVASDVIASSSIVGRTQIFTASGTFIVPATSIEIEGWAAGGAGGASSDGAGASLPAGAAGAGGGAGAYGYKRLTGLTIGSTVAVTIGAGGLGVASAALTGGSGGSTSFAAHMTLGGGQGGASGRNATILGGAGGSPTGADIGVSGGRGGTGGPTGTFAAEYPLHIWNKGGIPARPFASMSMFGTGSSGTGYGDGGSGASGGSGFQGGNGGPGLLIVRW
jgi:hypothetical protein